MIRNSKRKLSIKVILAVGFTIFASFFGAGNLIFPPFLGLHAGSNWFYSFLAYILLDAGIGTLTFVAIVRYGNGFEDIAQNLGVMGTLLIFADALCLGPMSCIPRTGAVTFELAIHPILPIPAWVVSILFFSVACFFSIKPSKLLDVIGNILSPLLMLALLIMIVKGIFSPAEPFAAQTSVAQALKDGIEGGYQTMDMLVATLLYAMLFVSTAYLQLDKDESVSLYLKSGLIATAGLFVIYGGLTYLGAVSGQSLSMSNSDVLLAVVRNSLGSWGQYLLSVIVTLACLTTAISLIYSCSAAICRIFHNRISIKVMIISCSAISAILSTLGISAMLKIASPMLDIIYPMAIILVVLSFLPKHIETPAIYRTSCAFALVCVLYTMADKYTAADLGSSMIPLNGIGMGWILPACAGGLLAWILRKK